MAGASTVGALRVNLGLNSAQFEQGLDRANMKAVAFGTVVGNVLYKALERAAQALAEVAASVSVAINKFDELGKLSQSLGIPVEALSRLKYAAELSNVEIEGLSAGLRVLNQRMSEIAQGGAAGLSRQLEAIGVSVTNADGTLRSSVDVLGQVADVFASTADGAGKTALAIELFGRQGAALIPLLNAGAAGLAEMAAEADRLGVTIDTGTAKAAEAFNDNLTRLKAGFDGIIVKLTAALLPTLVRLSQFFVDLIGDGQGLVGAMESVDLVLKTLITTVTITWTAFKSLADAIVTVTTALQLVQIGQFQTAGMILQTGFADIGAEAEAAARRIMALWGAVDELGASPSWGEFQEVFGELRTGAELPTIEIPPVEGADAAVEELGRVKKALKDVADTSSMEDFASSMVGLFGQIFQNSKVAAIAQAVLNTYQGISKTLATYPWPQAGILAALHGAAGIAQVARIRATTDRSTSVSTAGLGGGGSAEAEEARGPTHLANITLNGSSGYSADQIRALVEQIRDLLGDGPGGSQFLVTTR